MLKNTKLEIVENTKIAIVGVILMALVSIWKLDPVIAKEVVLVIAGGLIGYIAKGKEV